MRLSIVIPTYKEHDNLKELLPKINAALSSQSIDFDVLIVDDDSADGSQELIAELSKILPVSILVRRGVRGHRARGVGLAAIKAREGKREDENGKGFHGFLQTVVGQWVNIPHQSIH